MAKMQMNKKQETVMKPVVIETKTFVLELNELEIAVVETLLRSVGGCPINSFRKYTQTILSSVYEVSNEFQSLPEPSELYQANFDSVYFSDTAAMLHEYETKAGLK